MGAEKIVNAVRNGEKVDIVHFAVGDGEGLPYRPTRDMTALKNEVWNFSPQPICAGLTSSIV